METKIFRLEPQSGSPWMSGDDSTSWSWFFQYQGWIKALKCQLSMGKTGKLSLVCEKELMKSLSFRIKIKKGLLWRCCEQILKEGSSGSSTLQKKSWRDLRGPGPAACLLSGMGVLSALWEGFLAKAHRLCGFCRCHMVLADLRFMGLIAVN